MKYYLIVGEASGDLHASNLMRALKELDKEADFRFFGGDLMSEVGGTRVKHYKELAYMGFIPVLLHLRTIFKNMDICKADIVQWNPDVVILVDYPGFNLKVAEYIKKHTNIPVYYYISPKIWAWKEYRIKNIKRDVDELFSILPFEVPFFKGHQVRRVLVVRTSGSNGHNLNLVLAGLNVCERVLSLGCRIGLSLEHYNVACCVLNLCPLDSEAVVGLLSNLQSRRLLQLSGGCGSLLLS